MTLRRMTMDLAPDQVEPPAPGDVVYTPRRTYRVTACREVESRVWCNRWMLTLELMAKDAQPAVGATAHHTTPYKRGERPVDVFGVP